jgi:TolA-binding protein
MKRALLGAAIAALLTASVGVQAQNAPQPGAPGLTPLNLSMEKLQLEQLKCKALEAEANFHGFNAMQLGKERDALNARIKELEAKVAELEALQPKENPPAVDILRGNPP